MNPGVPTSLLRKIPGFGSGKWWKALIAGFVYFFLFITALAIIIPTAPSLALEQVKPTNQSSTSIAGKTLAGKPVYLLKDREIVQSSKADSDGKFYLTLNNLNEGNFTYTVEACDSEKRKHCKTENVLIKVDKTPPAKPFLAFSDGFPETEKEEITIKGTTEPLAKVVTKVGNTEFPEIRADDKGGFEIKTGLVLGANTVAVMAMDNVGNVSETTVSKINYNPQRQKVKVVRVIDGDTIEIEGGQNVRYIGIDTPETVHPSKPVECYGKEASEKNKELVDGKEVELEKDVSETDKYERLLRYVWIGDLLVNEYLVREGYAQSSSYPPDIKYQDKFIEAQKKAREEKKGLWSSYCVNLGKPASTPKPPTSTTTQTIQQVSPTPPPAPPPPPAQTQSAPSGGGGFTCNCSKTCPQMSSCEEAYFQLNNCGCSIRDGDKDGVPCENICPGG